MPLKYKQSNKSPLKAIQNLEQKINSKPELIFY